MINFKFYYLNDIYKLILWVYYNLYASIVAYIYVKFKFNKFIYTGTTKKIFYIR